MFLNIMDPRVYTNEVRCLDEIVDGKLLPKGTIIFVNVWGLHHDESKFPNPDIFDPDRYLDRPLLAAEYANSADFENRDHYGYGLS
jgi:cytochrome P450